MKLSLSTFLAGLIFRADLTVSQMVNPTKVIAFLDIFEDWDLSLAFVMGGDLLVSFIGYKFVLNSKTPLFDEQFRLHTRKDVDPPLIIGAAFFGIGWGLAGLCPGLALSSLSFAGQNGFIFVASMLVSIAAFRMIKAQGRNV